MELKNSIEEHKQKIKQRAEEDQQIWEPWKTEMIKELRQYPSPRGWGNGAKTRLFVCS